MTTEDVLEQTASAYGQVTFCHLCMNQDTNESRGFGFVCIKGRSAANQAIEALNGLELQGQVLEAKEVEPRPRSSNPLFNMECYAFKRGSCKFGSQCRFSHSTPEEKPEDPMSQGDAPSSVMMEEEDSKVDATMVEDASSMLTDPSPAPPKKGGKKGGKKRGKGE